MRKETHLFDEQRKNALELPYIWWNGIPMAKPVKMTFTLDASTAERIDRTTARLGMSKSKVVRDAVSEYATRAGRMSESERLKCLAAFDEFFRRIPSRSRKEVDAEIAEIRRARRQGGRKTPLRDHR